MIQSWLRRGKCMQRNKLTTGTHTPITDYPFCQAFTTVHFQFKTSERFNKLYLCLVLMYLPRRRVRVGFRRLEQTTWTYDCWNELSRLRKRQKGWKSGFECWVAHKTFTQEIWVHVPFETKHHPLCIRDSLMPNGRCRQRIPWGSGYDVKSTWQKVNKKADT